MDITILCKKAVVNTTFSHRVRVDVKGFDIIDFAQKVDADILLEAMEISDIVDFLRQHAFDVEPIQEEGESDNE